MAAVNFKQIALYVTPAQHAALKVLAKRMDKQLTVLLREAVHDLLKKHAHGSKK